MASNKSTQTRPQKVVLPKMKELTPDQQQALSPYQQGLYHGMIEMLAMVKTALSAAQVDYEIGGAHE